MVVLLFYERFHAPILEGRKFLTIRAKRGRPIASGDDLSLRAWSGKPYRSPQRTLIDTFCLAATPVRIAEVEGRLSILLDRGPLLEFQADEFARADGFADAAEMLRYYRDAPDRALPFSGELICWPSLAFRGS